MSEKFLAMLTPIEFGAESTETREERLSRLHASADRIGAVAAWAEFTLIHDDFEQWAPPVRTRLLFAQVAWSDEEARLAKDVHKECNQLARVAYRITQGLLRSGAGWDERLLLAVAKTLHLMAETVKWEVAVAPGDAHDYRKPHHLMREAMIAREHRRPIPSGNSTPITGCTVEALYFRVLLLARFSGGALNARQIEILDTWMFQWMPSFASVADAPPGSALRADLDSAGGLRRGPRDDRGPSLYLPQGSIEKAYRAVLAQFHEGQIVAATGLASTFRVEEYVVVLDIIQEGLKLSRRTSVERATREACHDEVELLVGLGEIGRAGFGDTHVAGLASSNIYQVKRRMVLRSNQSDSGLGLEGPRPECAGIAAGDVVAIRISTESPLILGVVARNVPARDGGTMVIGVRRLGKGVQQVEITRLCDGVKESLLLVIGADAAGKDDAFLVPESSYAIGTEFVATVQGATYAFRFNRARERGRGWLLAGFEIVSARREEPATEAPLTVAG